MTGNKIDYRKKWTPEIGLRKALIAGCITALILSITLIVIALLTSPVMIFSFTLRIVAAFVITWILFAIIHRAAGMTSPRLTALAVTLALLVMLSNHLIMAFPNFDPNAKEPITESANTAFWLSISFLFYVNIPAFLGIGFCTAFSYNGVPGLDATIQFLTSPMHGTRR